MAAPMKRIGTLDMEYLTPKSCSVMPQRFIDDASVLQLLREALAQGANDIHINSDHPVIIEVDGDSKIITQRPIDWTEFQKIADVLRQKPGATNILQQQSDYDGQFPMSDHLGVRRRLRVSMTPTVNVRSARAARIVLRPMQEIPPMPDEIGMDEDFVLKLFPQSGAVYVIGSTGSGKTTTFASLFRYAAVTGKAYHGHLATYEAPPEYDLESLSSKHLWIIQTAINEAWGLSDFAQGVRNGMRCHPTAMMIGEVRDLETVKAVVESALTGHPVFGTVHASSPEVAFQRLLSRYPSEQRTSGLDDLIMTTEAIVAQRLVKKVGGGRLALREWIVFTEQFRDELLSLPDSRAVIAAIRAGVAKYGQSFETSARKAHDAGQISDQVLAANLKV
jgi:defect-in-organelle-trafficking protein DotB